MKDPNHETFERLRRRAVAIGNAAEGRLPVGAAEGRLPVGAAEVSDAVRAAAGGGGLGVASRRRGVGAEEHRELVEMLKSPYPIVRKAAAGALAKVLNRFSSFAPVSVIPLMSALERETGEQTQQYMLKALLPAAEWLNAVYLDTLRDLVRNPTRKPYVRTAAAEVLAAAEKAARVHEARKRHWCTRCRRPVTAEESAEGIRRYGKPYCRHCLEERRFEDLRFEADVEAAKRLRTVDSVAVQSQGEKCIGDWLARQHIGYHYDERIRLAGDLQIRPDFYLPEFDVYIEYWGMDTPEYVDNMRKKQFLYQRDHKRLISLSWRDQNRLEELLAEKLSRYVRLEGSTPVTSAVCGDAPRHS